MSLPVEIIDRAIQMCHDDMNEGICLACHNDQPYCEPDAREYECEVCGENKVYGAQEILFMYSDVV